jgi:excisionase family DNA binding protein
MPAPRDARSRGQLPTWLGWHPPTLAHHPRGRSAADISDHTKHVPDDRAPSDLLTADELATQLRRSRDWVYRRARAGELPGALRLDSGWRFRKADIDAWLAPREQNPPAHPSGMEHSQPEGRVAPQKADYDVKITVRRRTQGFGGLEVDLFWTDTDGHRRRMRRASPYESKIKTRRWAEQLIKDQLGPDALPELEALEQPIDENAILDDSPMFSDFVLRFLALCESAAAGRRGANSQDEVANKRGIIEHHLEPFFGRMQLSKIGPRQIDAYVCEKSTERSKRTGKPLSGSTMANHLGLLRRMLKVAHRWDLISKVPEVVLPRKGSVENYLTRRETRALLDKVDPLFRDLVLVAVRTGMRLGELRELRVGDIDLRGARIRVKRQRTQRGQVKAPKGDKARTVQVPADAVAVLRRRISGLDRDDLVFSKPAGYLAGHRNEEPAQGGEPWSHRDIIGAVKRGAKAAKLGRSLGVHTLRHTFATHAVAAGVPLSVVSRQLGHADIQTTMRYAHHAPELTPGIFDRLSEGGDFLPADPELVDESSTRHPLEIEKARNREISGP